MSNTSKSTGSGKKPASTTTRRKSARPGAPGNSSADPSPASSAATATGSAQAARGTSDAAIKHKYLQQLPPDESFADGAHGVIMSRNVLKLDLYRVVRYDEASKEEIRSILHRIVLPMTAVPELVNLLQGIVQAVQGAASQQHARSPELDDSSGESSSRQHREVMMAQGGQVESVPEQGPPLKV